MLKLFTFLVLVHFTFSANLDWYKTASFYQIYPQTFYDGGGGDREGFGTFKGIQQKIPYLKELGIDCIWLTPIFKTAYRSFGYDITDYEDIETRYGTKQDFKNLIDEIHNNNMKIIVDFVPNHCSFEHEFFKKSMEKDSVYDKWFVWLEGKGENKTLPPSNWQRIGGGLSTAWNRHINGQEINRTEFFYAQFSATMPDLNLRNEQVKEYWKKFLKMWLEFGLDGFRIDAISHGIEYFNADGTAPDEAIVEGIENENDFNYLNHTYTQDQPELFELVYDWREVLDTFNDSARIFMTESYSKPETIMKFYRNENSTRKGAHLPFNFQLIQKIKKNSTAETFVNTINEWFRLLPEGEVTNWAIGNHDQSRVATKYGTERIDIFNFLCTMLPGTSVTYYGEEIGMQDSCVYYDADTNNPGHRCNETHRPLSDAPFRTPMQWTNGTNGGFTNSSKPWLPIGDDYLTVNVAAQQGVKGSHLEIYKSLIALRKHKAVKEGTLDGFKIVKLSDFAFGFKRELKNIKDESLLILINYGNDAVKVNLTNLELYDEPNSVVYKIIGNSKAEAQNNVGKSIEIGEGISIEGNEALVLGYNNANAIYLKFTVIFLGIILFAIGKIL
ncbi:hypothetical protein PVAND_017014 [Polypedilum vanderplanki]|uniref:alpha-glucosidase n=1 Tax=Polypedilum vanderplanki TaxID=319348 RepID=A0A9J6BI50_POLVA|nr:hypothetical protein PVAND_017014 [Polypedilum vanderplanki]